MKKVLLLLSFLVAFFVSNAQYPVVQFLGSDSSMVKSRGGLQGRFAPIPFTDTTSANLSRIAQYPGALIYTSVVDKYWYRNSSKTGWIEFTSSGGATTNIYNSNGILTSDRNLDGGGQSLGFHTLSKLWTQSDTLDFELNGLNKIFTISGLTETQDTTTYKPVVIDQITGRVLQSSYWFGGGGGSDGYVDSVRFNSTTNILTVYQNTAADQSVYLPPSYLTFDSSYTPLGGMRNDSTGIIKSVRIRRNSITVTPTQIGDSAMYWDISVPTTYIDSIRRVGMNVQVYKNGAWENAYTDSVGAGGSGTNNANIGSGYRWLNPGTQELRTFFAGLYTTLDSSSNTNGLTVKIDTASMFPAIRATISGGGGASVPSGNYGNGVVIRNGALAVPGSDSLNFSGGLAIKGTLSATALPTSGVDADSVVVINSSGAFKKRNVSAFARMNTTSAANQFALFNGNGTLYSSSKFVFSDATYPSMSIVGSDPLMYFGGTGAAYPSIGKSGNSIAIYGPSTGKSIGFYDQLVGGKQMLRLYTTSGSVATFSKTAITLDTAVGGPSIGSVHVEYNAGDSTSAGTDVGRHMFRGIGRTYANAGSFNTFYSTVEAGNTTYSQDHIISWQSDAKKTGANTLDIIYHLGILGDSIKAGTVNNRYGVYMYDAKVTAGATLAHQSALRVPKLASAVRNYDMFSDSAQTVKMDGNLLIGDSSLATGARKTIHLFNGTAPSSNISGSILYSESGEFKIRNGSGAINTLSGNAVFSGTITTADPGAGAGAWKFGQFHSASGLILDSAGYIEVNIGGTVYWLALAATPFPKPNPKP